MDERNSPIVVWECRDDGTMSDCQDDVASTFRAGLWINDDLRSEPHCAADGRRIGIFLYHRLQYANCNCNSIQIQLGVRIV
jgi:hypothetical protein